MRPPVFSSTHSRRLEWRVAEGGDRGRTRSRPPGRAGRPRGRSGRRRSSTRPPSKKAGTSSTPSTPPSDVGEGVGLGREVAAQRRVAAAGDGEAAAPSAATAATQVRRDLAVSRAASASGRLRELVRTKKTGQRSASSAARSATSQRASTGVSWTVCTPVGSSSSATSLGMVSGARRLAWMSSRVA